MLVVPQVEVIVVIYVVNTVQRMRQVVKFRKKVFSEFGVLFSADSLITFNVKYTYTSIGKACHAKWMIDSLGRVDPLSYFSLQPVLHDWCNKGRGMCYPVCGMVHIKEPLLLIDKSNLCGGSGFPFSLSEWSTICLTPYNRR